ncbi:MAG TPA: M20/M25/M40 family metallo-hydrolase [Tepidisphaeraceae bacterium]|nr:M20/M25/M40 family metallo-hydrolase [Tepidisphaeraceae bacterium]
MTQQLSQSTAGVCSEDDIVSRRGEMLALLRQSIRFPSVSGKEEGYTRFLALWAKENGFEVDLFEADEGALTKEFGALPRHIPLAGRPVVHVLLKGNPGLPSLIFNGHTDVVPADKKGWRCDPWEGCVEGSVVYGRGACDVKGPIVAALWAMLVIKETTSPDERGDIALELVPGEEDCIGLGTQANILRGHVSDGVVVLEPTEGMPRCASRGGCQFEIVATGRAVHGTVKWLGVDAIGVMQNVLKAISTLENRRNDRAADAMFARYPIARPITVDRVNGGGWQGMICDRCTCQGYLEMLPGDELGEQKKQFCAELWQELRTLGEDAGRVEIGFSEEYHGHFTDPESSIGIAAKQSVDRVTRQTWEGWHGFNSGCDAGVRASVTGTPTLVWGPGSLEFAHAADERIDFVDVELAARHFLAFAMSWGSTKENNRCPPLLPHPRRPR